VSRLDTAVAEARERYAGKNPKSRERYEAAAAALPGGNTRTVLYHPPFPLGIVRGEGCRVWDADGHQYVNLVEGPFAAAISARIPSMELLRFTNSGTEANTLALATAKLHTGRRKVLVFDGGYHGSVLSFHGGHGDPLNLPHEFVIGTYNDPDVDMTDEFAAILVEPVLGSGGCIPGTPEFLSALRHRATEHGALLIFDEVMTSRLSAGGRQALLGITPDLTTIGKYIGGGMSFGAFGGRRDVMERFDPSRPDAVAHPGTFNNNVLTMSAGLAGLTEVYTPEAAVALNARGDALRERLNGLAAGLPAHFSGIGSMLAVHFLAEPPRTAADADRADPRLRELFFLDLLERGIHVARRGMVALSLAVGDTECDQFAAAVEAFLADRREFLAGS
jgi:glutamate-1-semialdehyde 2,1-aminomutase